jgi:peroxisomal 3,2-trans-enoyl-CoA isomerase
MIDFRKPIFALVNGPALGIGVTMLGLCDVNYATASAYLTTQFTVLGVCPEACSSYFFPRIMGHARVRLIEMLHD